MPSKNSKVRTKREPRPVSLAQRKAAASPQPRPTDLWRDEPGCDEARLVRVAHDLAAEVGLRDRIFLEGPMGAGKSTFARAFLKARGVETLAEGSPTFSIIHAYDVALHLDLYRLDDESELENAGVHDALWPTGASTDRPVLVEWASKFPELEGQVVRSLRAENQRPSKSSPALWLVELRFSGDHPNLRDIRIARAS